MGSRQFSISNSANSPWSNMYMDIYIYYCYKWQSDTRSYELHRSHMARNKFYFTLHYITRQYHPGIPDALSILATKRYHMLQHISAKHIVRDNCGSMAIRRKPTASQFRNHWTKLCTLDNVRKRNHLEKCDYDPPAWGRSAHTWYTSCCYSTFVFLPAF